MVHVFANHDLTARRGHLEFRERTYAPWKTHFEGTSKLRPNLHGLSGLRTNFLSFLPVNQSRHNRDADDFEHETRSKMSSTFKSD